MSIKKINKMLKNIYVYDVLLWVMMPANCDLNTILGCLHLVFKIPEYIEYTGIE